jgi:hypothetical protein
MQTPDKGYLSQIGNENLAWIHDPVADAWILMWLDPEREDEDYIEVRRYKEHAGVTEQQHLAFFAQMENDFLFEKEG